MNLPRPTFRSLLALALLLSAWPSATYAGDAEASPAPGITRLDTTPIGFGSGRIKGRSYANTGSGDLGLNAVVYCFHATAYTRWYFDRLFYEFKHHEPGTAWPLMDERVMQASGTQETDGDGYFTFHGIADGEYYVVQFGGWNRRETTGATDSITLVLLGSEEPVRVAAGKVAQIDRSDEREADMPCYATLGAFGAGVYHCDELGPLQFVKWPS